MNAMHSAGVMAAALWCGTLARAHDPLPRTEASPRTEQVIVFDPPAMANIRLASGAVVQRELLSISAKKLIISQDKRTQELAFKQVRSVVSLDRTFTFRLAAESFEELVRRAGTIKGVSVVVVESDDEGHAPDPRPDDSPSPDSGPAPGTARPAPAVGVSEDAGTGVVCATCLKEVPATLKDGDRCPHCGTVIWSGGPAFPDVASHGGIAPADASDGGPAHRAPGPVALPGTQPFASSGTAQTAAGGHSFDSIPMWIKGGLFIGLLALAWVLLQRR